MTITSIRSAMTVQMQALAIVRALEIASADASDPKSSPSDIAKAAAGLKLSDRTAASLADLSETQKVKLGYTRDQSKQFQAVMDGAHQYLEDLSKLALRDPKTFSDADKLTVATYTPDAIASMQKKLDDIEIAYSNGDFTFQSFAITTKGDVSISAKVLQANGDGTFKSLLNFSFSQSMTEDKKGYAALWMIDDQALLRSAPKRVL